MNRRVTILAVLAGLCLLSAAMAAEVVAPPAEGSAVEVREGDSWSPATFVRKEGRRLLIRYDDGSAEEWITPDRMRVAKGASAKSPASKSPSKAASTDDQPADNSTAADAAAGGSVTLDGPFIEITMDNAPEPRRIAASAAKQTPTTRPSNPFTKITLAEEGPLPEIGEFLTCADTPDILIGVSNRHSDKQFELVRIDLQHPDKSELRTLVAPEQAVQSAADGGRLILTKPRDGNAVTLHLWEYVGEAYKLKANYTLASKKGGKKVEWATLVTPTRVAVDSGWGEMYLVDLKARRAICFLQQHGNKPSFHPTGRLLQVANSGPGGVLRASDFGGIAELPDTSPSRNVSVDPTGTVAAYVSGNMVRVVRLGSGAAMASFSAPLGNDDKLNLLSADMILIGDVLYEVKTGIPVWEYAAPPGTRIQLLPSGQVLYAMPQNGTTAACMITLPEAKALERLKSQRPDDYLLAPGAQIAVAGDLSMYGSQDKVAQELVKRAITSAGHKLTPGASSYKLTFTSAAGLTEELHYRETGYMGPPISRKVSAPSTIVTATLSKNGQTIWQQAWRYGAGGMLMRQGNQTMEQAAVESAKPNAQSLNSMALPAYIPKGSTPGAPATLGASSITPDGFGPAPERKKEDQPGENRPDGTPKAPTVDQHTV